MTSDETCSCSSPYYYFYCFSLRPVPIYVLRPVSLSVPTPDSGPCPNTDLGIVLLLPQAVLRFQLFEKSCLSKLHSFWFYSWVLFWVYCQSALDFLAIIFEQMKKLCKSCHMKRFRPHNRTETWKVFISSVSRSLFSYSQIFVQLWYYRSFTNFNFIQLTFFQLTFYLTL